MLDYLIVGFGLGGASLAFEMEKRSRSFIVFEDQSQQASKVAAGIMNPVVLKRFSMAWKGDTQLLAAKPFYRRLENHLKKEFLFPLELYRRFASIEEQNDWFEAADRSHLAAFLDTALYPQIPGEISGDFSFGRVLQTARLDTHKMLESYQEYLQKREILKQTHFSYDELVISESHVEYRGKRAKNIIFCEGFGLRKNPFFNYLPLRGVKGEYLIIKSTALSLNVAVKASVFILPLGEGLYAIGATYDNKDQTAQPTNEASEELLSKLRKLTTVEFEVVDQVAGIRPVTNDRKPLVGKHPHLQNLYCCNGFGSRGLLAAPTFSAELLDFIEKSKPLTPEVDLNRFTKKYFPKS